MVARLQQPGAALMKRIVQVQVSDPNGFPLTVGNGKAYFRVDSLMNGWKLAAVNAACVTASSSGLPTVQFTNLTGSLPMLSTPLTLDVGETDSSTAATPAVINPANATVATADHLRVDVSVAGTGTIGLLVEMVFSA